MAQLEVNGVVVPCPSVSPNSAARPAGVIPWVIVLHSTGGSFKGAHSWLMHRGSGVSAHLLVGRPDKQGAVPAVQLVPFERQAWHAGVSVYRKLRYVNQFSIGIEMEHLDGKQDWPAAQVTKVAQICAALMEKFPKITVDAVVGHASICDPPGRKVDPEGFPWLEFRAELRALLK